MWDDGLESQVRDSSQLGDLVYRAAFDNSPSGFGVVRPDADGRHVIVEANPSLGLLFGAPEADLAGRCLDEVFVDGESRLALSNGWTEYLCRDASGQEVWTRWYLTELADTDLHLAQVDVIHDRVIARRQAQRQARLLDLIPDPVIVRALDGTILYWNGGAAEVYGYTAEQAVGRRTHELLQTLFHEITLDGLEDKLATTGSWQGQLEHTTADGRILRMASKHVRDSHGAGQPVILEINVDISNRLEAEQALAASEAKFRGQFEHSTVGQMIRRLDGTIEEANQALADMLGYERTELIGMHVDRLFSPTSLAARNAVVQALVNGEIDSVSGESMLARADGSLLDAEINASASRAPDGTLERIVNVFQDITSRKVAEHTLTYRASHDPLTGLANRALLTERVERALRKAQAQPHTVGLLYLDLDGFKAVNDQFGHHAGDALLAEVASRLQQCVRGGDTVARIGGDEFVVLCPDLDAPGRLRSVAGRVLAKLGDPYELDSGYVDTVTASIGISYPRPDDSPGRALREADRAMYLAKRSGKNRVGHFASLETVAPVQSGLRSA